MATYEIYKDSGVKWLGQIPSHWGAGKMREFFSERKQLSHDGSEMLLSVSEYSGITPSVNEAGENVSRSVSLIGYKKCKSTDLIINIMLAWKRGLGISDYDGIVSPAYCVFETHNINPHYANYLLRTDLYTAEFKRNSTGIIESRLRMYPDDFKNIVCINPPMREQEAIVAYLDKVTAEIDRAIEAQQKMIDTLNERKQIIITRAVTRGLNPDAPLRDSGLDWLGQIPVHWNVVRTSFVFPKIGSGTTPSSNNEAYYYDNGIHWLQTGDLNDGILRETSKCISSKAMKEVKLRVYPKNSIVIAMYGATIGKTSIVDFDTTVNQACCVLPANSKCNSEFALFYFQSTKSVLIQSAKGGGQPNINQQLIRRHKMVLPPQDEQKEIVNYIQLMTTPLDKSIANCERLISLLLERKQIIINEVVTGKKKVI